VEVGSGELWSSVAGCVFVKKIAQDTPKIAQNRPKLPKIAQSRPKTSKAARNRPKCSSTHILSTLKHTHIFCEKMGYI
jgi:hypothetical protein